MWREEETDTPVQKEKGALPSSALPSVWALSCSEDACPYREGGSLISLLLQRLISSPDTPRPVRKQCFPSIWASFNLDKQTHEIIHQRKTTGPGTETRAEHEPWAPLQRLSSRGKYLSVPCLTDRVSRDVQSRLGPRQFLPDCSEGGIEPTAFLGVSGASNGIKLQ